MSLLPLAFGVRRKSGAKAAALGRSELQKKTKKALERDGYACRCCGFQSPKYMRVVTGDLAPGAGEDFVSVCPLCEMVLSLDKVGTAGSGVLIWLPEISQAQLHHIMRALYIVRDPASGAEPSLVEAAQRAYDALMGRRTEAKRILGSDDPLLLATVMQESLNSEEYAAVKNKIEGIRLLPLDRWVTRDASGEINHFPKMVEYWRSAEGPYAKLPVDMWKKLFVSVRA